MSTENNEKQTFEFKAEIKQLLNILVHSLYTSREIFLRELISNASDALDKVRFESTRGTEIIDADLPHEIKINFDDKKNTITISDTGIGLTKEEAIENLGTIAKSGSADFLKALKDNKEQANNIIGKFGVGFYSVFMVADEVEIKSKSYKKDAMPIYWKSDGLGSYEIIELEGSLKRGTTITLHLREDAKEFAEKYRLENVIKKHSNFITFPIYLGEERINTVSAIWREPKSSIKKEQYVEFYKSMTYDNEEPMDIIHKSVDAPIQFNALLFIPAKQDQFFWMDKENYGLDLYVKRVLIQHKNKDLLPEYLAFVKGVVDSEDLPLNISRETLQENVVFAKISQSVTSNVLNHLSDKAKNSPEEYIKFWKEHSQIFKLGYSDYANHEKFMELLRFNSSANEDKSGLTSLSEYTSRIKDDQKEIYYASGSSREAIESDPHLEIFKSKGLEVLYLYEPVDEFVVSSLNKYKDYDFKSVENVDLAKLDKYESVEKKDEEKFEELSQDDEKHFSSLLSKMKEILGDKVKEVRESKRLSGSPAVLVSEGDELTSSMKKILKMSNQNLPVDLKIMEVNRENALIRNLIEIFKKDAGDKYIKDATEQLYESSLLLDGDLQDPYKMVKRMNELLENSSSWYLSSK